MGYSFINFMSICDNIMFLKVMSFIKTLLDIVCFIVPMGLIVMVSLDFAKNVISGRDDDMKKNLNLVIKRLIYAVALFLVPTIVDFAINGLASSNVDYEKCFNVTKKEISAKIAEQKAKCVGDNYWWSDVTYSCNEREEYNETAPDTYNTIKRNFSDSAYSSSNSNNVNANGGVKNMTYYNQGEYASTKYCSSGKTLKSSGCGAVSLAMMTTAFSSSKYDPVYVAKWLCNNGHKGGATPWEFFTKKSMLSHFGLQVDVLFKKSGLIKGNAGKTYNSEEGNKILSAVQQGKGVILHIPGHYVAVGPNEKCKSGEVYLYDVGGRANNGCYTPKKLFEKTYNNKNRCKSSGNCGWKAAFAYIGQ